MAARAPLLLRAPAREGGAAWRKESQRWGVVAEGTTHSPHILDMEEDIEEEWVQQNYIYNIYRRENLDDQIEIFFKKLNIEKHECR